MNKKYKSFYYKIYAIMVLCLVIVCGLIYLIFSGASETLENNWTKPTPSFTTSPISTPIPTQTPVATTAPSIQPTLSPEIQYDTESDTSLYKLVTRDQTIDPNYVPSDLKTVPIAQNGEQEVSSVMIDDLVQMFIDANTDGVQLYLVSGYRSYSDQVSLYNYYKNEFGEEYANSIDAIPSASEHQLGLAVDLGDLNRACELDTCFEGMSSSEWLEENAYRYGFILRYPKDKENITGVIYSPWHYRYVGKDLAKTLVENNLTMEEYFE